VQVACADRRAAVTAASTSDAFESGTVAMIWSSAGFRASKVDSPGTHLPST
jgi:hypothetical protein